MWESAIPLADAYAHFLRFNVNSQSATHRAPVLEIKDGSSTLEIVAAVGKAILGIHKAHNEEKLAISDMREALLDRLFYHELYAYGYRVKPSKSAFPVKIASHFFEYPDIDWDASNAEFEGTRYSQIRIIDPNCEDASIISRKGRIGSGDAINAAIAELMSEGGNRFCEIPRKLACQQIRERLGTHQQNNSGLSDQNLSKYILKHCQTRQIK